MLSTFEDPATIPFVPSACTDSPNQPRTVLRVKTGQEFVVERHLAHRDIACYAPAYPAIRRFSDRRPVTILRSLLPGYILVDFDRHQSTDLLSTPHVIGVLTFAGIPQLIAPDEFARIQAMTTIAVEPWQRLTQGQRVRVISGPLTGAEGRIAKNAGQLQMSIEVTMLNRIVCVKIDGFSLEAA